MGHRAARTVGDDLTARPAPGPSVPGPLADVLVIDLTRVLSGPYATMMLSDLGARVIKVERPGVGDDARHIGPVHRRRVGLFRLGQPRQGVDRARPDRRRRPTGPRCDARPGRRGRRELPPGSLRSPGLRLGDPPCPLAPARAGLGVGLRAHGPLASRPAYDMIVQAMGGVMSITGEQDGPPTRVGTSIGDICAGMFTATSIIAALHQRTSTGVGARVDVAMLDSQVALLENAIARYTTTGVIPGPIGSRHPSITPFGAFATARGSVVIAAGNDELFGVLCDELGRPELAVDPRFASNSDRCDHEARPPSGDRGGPGVGLGGRLGRAVGGGRDPDLAGQRRGPGALPSPDGGSQHGAADRGPPGPDRGRQPDEDLDAARPDLGPPAAGSRSAQRPAPCRIRSVRGLRRASWSGDGHPDDTRRHRLPARSADLGSGATSCSRRSRPTRWSSSPARPARERAPSSPSSAWPSEGVSTA